MADKLKVLKNVNVTQADSIGPLSIPIVTTDTERLAIKDVQLEITNLLSGDQGFYKYPSTLQVDGVKQGSAVNLSGTNTPSTPMLLTGSQIVGPNSVVTLEIEAETAAIDYSSVQFLYIKGSDSSPSVGTFNMGAVSPAITGGSTLLNNAIASVKASAGPQTGYSGCCFTSNGIKKYAYTIGSKLVILGENGSTLYYENWGTHTCFAMGVDDVYCYGKTNGSQNLLKRFNHVTMSIASDLAISNSVAYGTSNPGWVDVYDGHFYYRPTGSQTTVHKINLTSGTATTTTMGNLAQTEFIGGVINTNVNGCNLLVMHQDQNIQVYDIDNSTQASASSIFPTNPTTTGGNNVISLAAGIIWVNNASYNSSMIIDTNSIKTTDGSPSSYTQTLTTSTISLSTSTSSVFVGGKHQSVSAKTRKMNHRVLVSGVEAT